MIVGGVSDGFRHEVRATDGVNTAVDESDSCFTVLESRAGPPLLLVLAGMAVSAIVGVILLFACGRASRRLPGTEAA